MGLEPIDIGLHVFSTNRINLSIKQVLNNDFCADQCKGFYSEVKNLVFWARSEILGFAFANKAALNPKHEIRNSKQ